MEHLFWKRHGTHWVGTKSRVLPKLEADAVPYNWDRGNCCLCPRQPHSFVGIVLSPRAFEGNRANSEIRNPVEL